MKKINIRKWALITICAIGLPTASHALSITLGGAPDYSGDRTATLSSAVDGKAGLGNATETEVNAYFGSLSPWTKRADVANGNGGVGDYSNGLLTVGITSGNWGSTLVAGTWKLSANFWTLYESAAISMHIGNGGGDPDHFVWLITPNELTGTWSFDGTGGTGGGLSNLKLYSSLKETPRVPDGGSALALIGLGVTAVAFLRRKLN